MPHVLVFFSYLALAALFIPRLLFHFNTAIPGGMEDTRLFLWNAWWFRHAIDTLHANPFFTNLLFHPFGSSLISHDYPLWTNLVTFSAQAAGMGLVASSNVWFLLSWALAGFCTYLVAWEVTRTREAAIVAGLYVMTHSYTLARAMQNWGQFNLYGIALFLWLLARARRTERLRDFILSGIALAWTAACHYYFLIYSGVIWAASVYMNQGPQIRWRAAKRPPVLSYSLLALGLLAGVIAGWILLLNPQQIELGGQVISMHTPANALLVMWVGLLGWGLSKFRITVSAPPARDRKALTREAALVLTALICLSPLLWGALKLMLSGDYPRQSILWKTHLPGANLFSLIMPNPLHALWGESISQWFYSRGMQPQEQAASIGWVCLVLVVWSGIWKKAAPSSQRPAPSAQSLELGARSWFWLAVSSTVLAMGTYLHIAQHNLWMPLPFYVWRLLPVLGNVRVPERWMAVGTIAWGVVLAIAIVALTRKTQWPIKKLCLAVGAAVLLENWPGIPLGAPPPNNPVFEALRKQPAGGVLPLPLYIGDSSVGAGSAPAGLVWDYLGTQVYHQHPMVGGYLGRISRKLIRTYESDPFLSDILNLEEDKMAQVHFSGFNQACKSMKAFNVAYVVISPKSLNAPTFNYATQSLPLKLIEKSGDIELYSLNCR